MVNRIELLKLVEHNARIKVEELAVMLNASQEEIIAELDACKKENVILGYNTMINWEKTEREEVTALIEVRITRREIRALIRLPASSTVTRRFPPVI